MKYTALLTSLLALAALPAQAGDRKPFGTGELPEIMKPFDVNADGKLSAEERQAFEAAMRDKAKGDLLKKFDTNGDGVLSPEELKAARDAARARMEEKRTARFNEMDTNKDGFLSPAEFKPPVNLPADLVTAIFNHLDKDKDGKISKTEFLAACAGPIGGGGTPPPPPRDGLPPR
jgi:Ca2+-binding EF-hand superfamily protein